MSVVHTALAAAVRQAKQLTQRARVDEEVITNAMMGMFFSSMAWTIAIFDQNDALTNRCSWGLYRKYSDPDVKQTERFSGADFAMLVSHGPAHALLALFQAKRVHDWSSEGKNRPAIDIHHRPPTGKDGVPKETQMLRLARFAQRLEDVQQSDEITVSSIKEVGWIHYVAYLPGQMLCMALSTLASHFPIEMGETTAEHMVHVPDDAVDFGELVDQCFVTSHNGWLRIEIERAVSALPQLVDLMPVMLGDEEGKLAAALSNSPHSALIKAKDTAVFADLRASIAMISERYARP